MGTHHWKLNSSYIISNPQCVLLSEASKKKECPNINSACMHVGTALPYCGGAALRHFILCCGELYAYGLIVTSYTQSIKYLTTQSFMYDLF